MNLCNRLLVQLVDNYSFNYSYTIRFCQRKAIQNSIVCIMDYVSIIYNVVTSEVVVII